MVVGNGDPVVCLVSGNYQLRVTENLSSRCKKDSPLATLPNVVEREVAWLAWVSSNGGTEVCLPSPTVVVGITAGF